MKKINEKHSLLQEKKDNNNNLDNSHNFLNIVTTFQEDQKTLFGETKIKQKFKLNKNYFHLLSMFYLNPDSKLTRNSLYYLKNEPMHINTVSNFLKESEKNGFIKKCIKIPGTTINNLFMFRKMPDTFIDGTICKDIRSTYYTITKFGKEIFELNEKMSSL